MRREYAPVMLMMLLGVSVLLPGCFIPVVIQAPPNTTPPAATPPVWSTETETPVMLAPSSATAPPPPVFGNVLPRGTSYTYTDNLGFHVLTVSVLGTEQKSSFYYDSRAYGEGYVCKNPAPGNKFLLVSVDFGMSGIRGEGKSSRFMTPIPTSFQLAENSVLYSPFNTSDMEDMESYYIRDEGSLYRDRFIDKDNEGSGLLVFEVPESLRPAGSYIIFCPRNLGSWSSSGYYRSPDSWDCTRDLVVWML